MKRLSHRVLLGFLLITFLGTIALLDSVAIGAEKECQKIVLRIGAATAGKHPQNFWMERFEAALEKATGGKIDVQTYPSSQLGDVVSVLQGLQTGTIEATLCPIAFLGGIASPATVVELPAFLPGSQPAAEIINSPAGNPMRDYLRTKGIELLSAFGGADTTILTRFPVTHIDNLKGKKIRVMGSKSQQMQIKALEAVPLTMQVSELMTAMQQGTLDGIQSDILFFYVMKYYELGKSLVMESGAPVIMAAYASKIWMDKLPPELKKAIIETSIQVTEKEVVPYTQKLISDNYKAVAEAGVKSFETPPDIRKALIEKYAAIPEEFLKDNPDAKPLYDSLLAEANKRKK